MNFTAAVITISDKGSRNERVDTSGPALCGLLTDAGWEVIYTTIIPDEGEEIKAELIKCADQLGVTLVLTTGGTGFAKRDVTPEATKAVIDREVPGIPEAMRAESMRITSNGCLSRSAAGIRKETLIVNLPGSEKAARENLLAVIKALGHGAKMLKSAGSADCAQPVGAKQKAPSMDSWLKEAKLQDSQGRCGMYLFHNGVVRASAKAQVRSNVKSAPVTGMDFSYDGEKVEKAVESARNMPGIYYVRVWLNKGILNVGDDIMQVLIGGDIRPNVIKALETLVGEIKSHYVAEKELF